MAELPALRSRLAPELFGRPHAYGVAQELERMRRGSAPALRAPRIRTRRSRPAPSRLGQWWAGRDIRPVDLWHRARCATGHHNFQGGRRLRCAWCDAAPPM